MFFDLQGGAVQSVAGNGEEAGAVINFNPAILISVFTAIPKVFEARFSFKNVMMA